MGVDAKGLARNKKTGAIGCAGEPQVRAIPITSSKLTIEAVSVGTFRKFDHDQDRGFVVVVLWDVAELL